MRGRVFRRMARIRRGRLKTGGSRGQKNPCRRFGQREGEGDDGQEKARRCDAKRAMHSRSGHRNARRREKLLRFRRNAAHARHGTNLQARVAGCVLPLMTHVQRCHGRQLQANHQQGKKGNAARVTARGVEKRGQGKTHRWIIDGKTLPGVMMNPAIEYARLVHGIVPRESGRAVSTIPPYLSLRQPPLLRLKSLRDCRCVRGIHG